MSSLWSRPALGSRDSDGPHSSVWVPMPRSHANRIFETCRAWRGHGSGSPARHGERRLRNDRTAGERASHRDRKYGLNPHENLLASYGKARHRGLASGSPIQRMSLARRG